MIILNYKFYSCIIYVFIIIFLSGKANQKDLFTDLRDSKTYRTVKIGDQVWLAENLNYVIENESWTAPCDSSGIKFGRFYTWKAAKEAVPVGWHLPSKQEFEVLASTLGVSNLPNWDDFYPLLTEGGISGLNIQLTGSHNQVYGKFGQTASFWSSDEWWFSKINPFSENPWRLSVRAPNYINIGHFADSKCGFNVRCLRNE